MSHMQWLITFVFMTGLLGCQSNSSLKFADGATDALTTTNAATFIKNQCASCHRDGLAQGRFASAGDPKRMVTEGLIVPGKPEESRLFTVIQMGFMPPSGPLDEHTVLTLREWIRDMDPYEGDATYMFSELRKRVLEPKCLRCHGLGAPIDLSSHEKTLNYVVKKQPEYSLLYEALHEGADDHGLTLQQLDFVAEWIRRGARE